MNNSYYHDRGYRSVCVTLPIDTLARIKAMACAKGQCLRAWSNDAVKAFAQLQMSGLPAPYIAPLVPGSGRSLQIWIDPQNADALAQAVAARISVRAWVYSALIAALTAADTSRAASSDRASAVSPDRSRSPIDSVTQRLG